MSRKYEDALRIQAAPEAVWKALTESEGVQSWFAPEVRVKPGPGGSIWVSWGPGMEGESRISAWEPGRHFGYISDRGADREPSGVDFEIAGDGGSTVLRLVHSGFGAGGSFDDEYESTARAWRLFFHMLKHSLENPHSVARNVTVFRFVDLSRRELFEAIGRAAVRGVVTFDDGVGFRCLEYPELNRSITGIFCEGCGKQTGLTVMSVLYDQTPEVEERVRADWTAVADSIVRP